MSFEAEEMWSKIWKQTDRDLVYKIPGYPQFKIEQGKYHVMIKGTPTGGMYEHYARPIDRVVQDKMILMDYEFTIELQHDSASGYGYKDLGWCSMSVKKNDVTLLWVADYNQPLASQAHETVDTQVQKPLTAPRQTIRHWFIDRRPIYFEEDNRYQLEIHTEKWHDTTLWVDCFWKIYYVEEV